MYIHEEKNVAFIAHPKTASLAMSYTLLDMGFEKIGSHHQFKEIWCRKTTFSVIRNPFDLFVSWYYAQPEKLGVTFEKWAAHVIQRPSPYSYINDLFFGLKFSTDVLHFENLQEDFDKFTEKVGLPQTEIKRTNVSERREGRNFADCYTPELTAHVVSLFERDILDNGYEIL